MSSGWYQLENARAKHSTTRATGVPGVQRMEPPVLPQEPAPPIPVESPRPPAPAPKPPQLPAPTPLPISQPLPAPPPVLATLPDPYGDQPCVLHSVTVGPCGPALMDDQVLHESISVFTHSKTVERVVHAKGWGAQGWFENQRSMAEYTCLPFLQRPGTRVNVAARFSLAAGNRGTPDTARNIRGFSTKFYTKEGVFDLLCNHLPVFTVRDAMRFPESIKAFLPAPNSGRIDPHRFWSFVARAPESMHLVTRLYSDAGTLSSFRQMRSFGVNTYVWRNAAGVRRYVKYHWLPTAGEACITGEEAARLACQDPDWSGRDLWDAIREGTPPAYELAVQLMDIEEAECLPYDPMDATKVWDEDQFPLARVGRLTLDRNPDNYVEQVEKLAFSPVNLLPGAELSDDKLLQGRVLAYADAQRYRLGPDYRALPVNAQAGWSPNRQLTSGLGVWTQGPRMRAPLERGDNFCQAGAYYDGLEEGGKAHLAEHVATELPGQVPEVREAVLGYFHRVSPHLAQEIRTRMG